MKIVAKNQKVLLHQPRADDALQEVVQALDQPFPEVLRALGDILHAAGRHLRKDNQTQRHQPGHHHGVGDDKGAEGGVDAGERHRALGQAVLLRLGCTGLARRSFGLGRDGRRLQYRRRGAREQQSQPNDAE